jgi:RimJ/RimL family protein N-acetyltransferase
VLVNIFHIREENPDSIVLVADHISHSVIGYISLREIDWDNLVIGNQGIRIKPSWCGKGVGAHILKMVSDRCFGWGFERLRLDVAATNKRAVHCYEKTGYVKTGEFWREAENLRRIDLNHPKYAFLNPHIRLIGDTPQIRFWWMDLLKNTHQ